MVCCGANPFYQVVSMILQSMLLSLAMLGQGSYDINEQQINQYLQSQVQVDKQLELPGIIKAHVQLEQSDVQIGRQSPDTARVFGKGRLKIALPDQTQYDALLNMTYEARPRYDKAKSALFLDNMKLDRLQAGAGGSRAEVRFHAENAAAEHGEAAGDPARLQARRQGSQPGLAQGESAGAGAVTGQDPPADQAPVRDQL